MAILTWQKNAEDNGRYAGRAHVCSQGKKIAYTSQNVKAKSRTEGVANEAVSDVTECRVLRGTTTDVNRSKV